MNELQIGQPAPDFRLTDQSGQTVTLASLRGQPVVLIFYPGDDTPVCVKQLCEIRDNWSQFQKYQIAAFGINPADAASHRRFFEKYNLTTPLLVDQQLEVSRAYGCTWKVFDGELIKRTVVVIDKDGLVRFVEQGLPSYQELIEVVKKFV